MKHRVKVTVLDMISLKLSCPRKSCLLRSQIMQYGTQIGSLLTRAETQRLVVDLYKQGMPIKEIAAQVPVCLATVYRWINLPKHKNVKQKAEPKTEDSSAGGDSKKSVNTDNINSETALLEAQIKELKAQLRAAELKACAYETMVNVAEKKFGIAIRKKHGAKQ